MTGHFNAAPLVNQCAIRADDEGAALDAAYLFAVHVFHLDHVKLVAKRHFGVGDQRKRETVFCAKIVM